MSDLRVEFRSLALKADVLITTFTFLGFVIQVHNVKYLCHIVPLSMMYVSMMRFNLHGAKYQETFESTSLHSLLLCGTTTTRYF